MCTQVDEHFKTIGSLYFFPCIIFPAVDFPVYACLSSYTYVRYIIISKGNYQNTCCVIYISYQQLK